MDTGYTTYYAEIEDTSSYLTSPKFGEVKNLYKKANISDIGYGKFVVQIEHISGDLYKIVGTSFVIEMMFASSYAFSGYGDYILDTTTFGGSVTKKE
jgi:hypothetical protein